MRTLLPANSRRQRRSISAVGSPVLAIQWHVSRMDTSPSIAAHLEIFTHTGEKIVVVDDMDYGWCRDADALCRLRDAVDEITGELCAFGAELDNRLKEMSDEHK